MSRHPPFDEVQASRPDFDADFKAGYTKTPEPSFRPGQGLNSLPHAADFDSAAPCRSVDTADIPSGDMYKLMISAITPRPIAFMSTVGKDGVPNLAPFSYFNMVSHDPPAIMVSIGRTGRGLKDSNTNIKETGEFCVSIISEPFVEAMNTTALDAPYDVSEWQLSGLTPRASERVKPPHVGESAFSMECTLLHWHDLVGAKGNNTMTVIVGKIERVHIKESVLVPGSGALLVAPEKLKPVSRMGGITYARSTQFYEIPRPKWADVESEDDVKAALAREAKTA